MKKDHNMFGKMDYFSSIGKLSDDFMPNKKMPLSIVEDYDYIGAFQAPKTRKYNPYKQQSTFLPPKKRFDPYKNTWGRMIQKTMHTGPAQSKELTKEEMVEVIHELKEKKDKHLMHDAHEIKMLSHKYMNSPWNAVPEKYRKKYGKMDFDKDGVPNDKDCYPFDYDRQLSFFGVTISNPFAAPAKSTPAPVKSTPAPAPKVSTPASAPVKAATPIYTVSTPVSSSKPTTSPVTLSTPVKTTSSTSSNYFSIPSTSSSSTKSTSSSSSSGIINQTVYRTGLTGEQISYDAGKTWTNVMLPTGGQAGAGSNPYTGPVASVFKEPAPVTPPALTPLEVTLNDFLYKYGIPYSGTTIDTGKQQQLYMDILNGKITDPAFKVALEAVMGPALTSYVNQQWQSDRGYQKQQQMLQSVVEKKTKDIALVGGANIANKYSIARAQQILQGRSDALASAKSAKDTAALNAYNATRSDIANAQVAANPSLYTTTISGITQMEQNIPKGTPIANLTPAQLTQYNALHK